MSEPTPEVPDVERAPRPPALVRRAVAGSLAGAILALFLFAWLAHEVFEDRVLSADLHARVWIHNHASPPVTTLMLGASRLGSEVLVVLLVISLIMFLAVRWRRGAAWLVLAMAGAAVLDLTLKYAFHRPRPLPFFGPVPRSYSFPSGHALFSFCFYGVWAGLVTARIRSTLLRVLVWAVAASIITAVGLSRIYLGVHYPSDVIAGYLAAIVWVSTLVALDRMRPKPASRLPPAPESPKVIS